MLELSKAEHRLGRFHSTPSFVSGFQIVFRSGLHKSNSFEVAAGGKPIELMYQSRFGPDRNNRVPLQIGGDQSTGEDLL
jgi:hypothetical protein